MKVSHPRWVWAVITAGLAATVSAQELRPEEAEFFESKIRPVLIEHCHSCHSADSKPKAKGGLYLDTKAGMLKGGSSGPVVVAGDPGKSTFIKRIRLPDTNDEAMPPGGKPRLTPEQLSDLEQWVRMGAPDPRTGKAVGMLKGDDDVEKAKKHWAFQPVKKPEIPVPQRPVKTWIKNPIDAFIFAKMEEKGVLPSLPADKWTLIRRAYFDLIGIPPTPEEAAAFMADEAPDAFSKVVDRLLASPHYGERWGRYWLDVARYADTTGANNRRGGNGRYLWAYTYRDYVIHAVNEDKPYDRFLIEQIAADRLPGDNQKALPALGFFSLGRRDRNQDEIIDDRIDVLTRGTLGLSVYCSRCHDHKFDPIPTKDYYSLYGIFNSTTEPEDRPVIETDYTAGSSAATNPDYVEFQKKIDEIETDRKMFRTKTEFDYQTKARTNTVRYMGQWYAQKTSAKPLRDRADREMFERTTKLDFEVLQSWNNYFSKKKADDETFAHFLAYAAIPTNKVFAVEAKLITERLAAESNAAVVAAAAAATKTATPQKKAAAPQKKPLNPLVVAQFPAKSPPASMADVILRYKALFDGAEYHWNRALLAYYAANPGGKNPDIKPPTDLPDAEKRFGYKLKDIKLADYEPLRAVLYGPSSPSWFTYAQLARMDNNRIGDREGRDFDEKIDNLIVTHPGSPPRAMSMVDTARPSNARVMIKGNRNNLGPEAPRQFLEILSGPDRQPFKDGSGRLELAKAIASKENPLTARVMVNRIWMNHFGAGIVRNMSDFGVRSDDPTHPELLDWLAASFMENGWSLKKLHKLIMLSNTYQQSSEDNPRYGSVDPSNAYLYKTNRRRLDFESFRDSLLFVSGQLDMTMGGQPVEITRAPYPPRRSVYAFIDRRNLPEMFRTFDMANPESTVAQRFTSTVPQQALFMLNSPMIAGLARSLVDKKEFKDHRSDQQRIASLYASIYQRSPEPIEMKLGIRFLEEESGEKSEATPESQWKYGYGNYDEVGRKLPRFYVLQHYTGKSWQGSGRLPDPQYGNLQMDAKGGHPGPLPQIAAVRRWIAPRDMTVNIEGGLDHYIDEKAKAIFDKLPKAQRDALDKVYDGVSGFMLHTAAGTPKELWRGSAKRGRANATAANIVVKKNDTIDFVVHCGKGPHQDFFNWAPVVKVAGMMEAMAADPKTGSMVMNEWKAADDFAPPNSKPKPLNVWEKYAQALLLSNETTYVD